MTHFEERDTSLPSYKHPETMRADRLLAKTQYLKAQRDLLLKAVEMALDDLHEGKLDLVRAGLDGALLTLGRQDK